MFLLFADEEIIANRVEVCSDVSAIADSIKDQFIMAHNFLSLSLGDVILIIDKAGRPSPHVIIRNGRPLQLKWRPKSQPATDRGRELSRDVHPAVEWLDACDCQSVV